MVSFSCEGCGDVLTKKKLDSHRGQCRGASFTCLDCMVHFDGTAYRAHTSCISEAQKYEGKLFKGERKKKQQPQQPRSPIKTQAPPPPTTSQALVARNAFVEDAPDAETGALAIVDAPPRAPTPPPAARSLPAPNVNVFDFMVSDTAHDDAADEGNDDDNDKMIADDEWQDEDAPMEELYDNHDRLQQEFEDKMQAAFNSQYLYESNGYSYGATPVQPSFQRWSSTADLLVPPPAYELKTPASKPLAEKREPNKDNDAKAKANDGTWKSTDKKRKRAQIEELDLSKARHGPEDEVMRDADGLPTPSMLHTGLTGGLSKMLTRVPAANALPNSPDYAKTPISPMKRTKHSLLGARENERGRDREPKSKKAPSNKTEVVRVRKSRKKQESPERVGPPREWVRRRRSSSETRDREPRDMPKKPAQLQQPPPSNMKMIEYRPGSVSSEETSVADMFLSFISRGPDCDRGVSLHKCLKKWRAEAVGTSSVGSQGEKDLWRALRLRRNDRGEIVMFI